MNSLSTRLLSGAFMRFASAKFVFLASCLVLASSAVRSDPLVAQWSKRFGDTADFQVPIATASDAGGNVIVVGYFQGTVNFGGANLTSAGAFDIFVAKFNSTGVHQWSYRFGDTDNDVAYATATDGVGNVFVVGYFGGTINLGGGNLTSLGLSDIFLLKLSPFGVHQWSQRFGDASSQSGLALDADASGNVVMGGNFDGTVNFGGSNLVSLGGDVFVAKFNAAGAHQWSQRFGDASDQATDAVVIDATGGVVIAGYFAGVINFGGSNLTSAGGYDVFVAKFNSGGVHQWSQGFGDGLDQVAYAVAADASSSVIIVGPFRGAMNFGGALLTSVGSTDMFVAKFNSAGVHQWSRRFGDAAEQSLSGLTTDPSGNVIVAGPAAGSVNFGGANLTSNGAHDIYVASFSSLGAHQWSQHFGDAADQTHAALAIDGTANVAMVGSFFGFVNFGGDDLESAGGSDIFVARFGSVPATPAITSILDIGNDQGGKVKIRFNRSGFDDEISPFPVVRYDAFRRDDPPPGVIEGDPNTISERDLLLNGWTQVGTITAYGDDTYGIDAPTIGDSTIANGQYLSTFLIRAGTNEPTRYYDSASAAGYSLDNLAPGVPSLLVYESGELTWGGPTDEDFDYFSVYGGNTDSFGTAILIGYTTSFSMNVGGSAYPYYFVTATDFSGNESNPATTNILTGAEGTPTSYVLSVSAYPNPFNPRTTIRYTLPARGRVTIAVYDARGMRVATLVDEEKSAGAYTEMWNGRDNEANMVSSGVYFARVTHASGTKSYKLVLLK